MPTPSQPLGSVAEALLRVGSMYGSAWRDGQILGEVIEVTGTVDIGRIDVPLVGRTSTGRKRGRETREGTIRLQKIDARWEMEVYNLLSQSLQTRRALRDQGQLGVSSFQLLLEWDDPDALGIEKWQLDGCQIWSLPLGGNFVDDSIVEREFTLTWESEAPIYAYKRTIGPNGVSRPTWLTAAPAAAR